MNVFVWSRWWVMYCAAKYSNFSIMPDKFIMWFPEELCLFRQSAVLFQVCLSDIAFAGILYCVLTYFLS